MGSSGVTLPGPKIITIGLKKLLRHETGIGNPFMHFGETLKKSLYKMAAGK
jgi:hypothetical protein